MKTKLSLMSSLLMALVAMSLSSCASKKTHEDIARENPAVKDVDNQSTIKKDYTVVDASSTIRPGWTVDAVDWAIQNSLDPKENRYFAFETEPKVSREMACNLAKSNARADVAGEVATFIRQTLGSSEEGQAAIDPNNPITQPLRSFVETSLSSKIQEVITGAGVDKSYWEKRSYKMNLGAKRDFTAYTCAVLVKIKPEILQSAIDQARVEILNRTQDKTMKDKVEQALQNVEQNFDKARGI
ncbi:MAG: hypothetical protein QE271_08595 [Bacteriovoracaceae bacterium]|nr:hypothetical protein [Bacteriovoracaceae bacterium]